MFRWKCCILLGFHCNELVWGGGGGGGGDLYGLLLVTAKKRLQLEVGRGKECCQFTS